MGLVVGAHVICLFNGRLMGQVHEASWDNATPRISRRGIDALLPYEISPAGAGISGTISIHRLHGDAGLEGRGLVAPNVLIPLEKYFSILLIDRVTGLPLLQADHCMVTKQSWRAVAKQRLAGSFSFEGIDSGNEFKF